MLGKAMKHVGLCNLKIYIHFCKKEPNSSSTANYVYYSKGFPTFWLLG
jgi:hypothetical protein